MALKGKSKSGGFNYKPRSKESIKERANMKGGNFDTIFKSKYTQWKPKEGKNLIRILPREGGEHYGLDIYVNYNIGADNQSYLSLSKMGKGDDPLAEARREAQKESDKDLVKALNPTQRVLYWIVDRNDEDAGPLLWASPFTFDKALANLCVDEDTKEIINIDDPNEGHDIRFYKEGTGLKTNYDPSKMKVLGESPISEDEGLQNEWLEFVSENPLEETLNFYDYDHIKMAFDGQAGRRDEDEDEEKPVRRSGGRNRQESEETEDDRPVRTRTGARADDDDADEDEKPVRKAKGRAVDDDDDEDVADEGRVSRNKRSRAQVEDDENDEPPQPRRGARSRVADDDDDADEADDEVDDDEEDEAPPTKSRRGKTEEPKGGSLRDKIIARRRAG